MVTQLQIDVEFNDANEYHKFFKLLKYNDTYETSVMNEYMCLDEEVDENISFDIKEYTWGSESDLKDINIKDIDFLKLQISFECVVDGTPPYLFIEFMNKQPFINNFVCLKKNCLFSETNLDTFFLQSYNLNDKNLMKHSFFMDLQFTLPIELKETVDIEDILNSCYQKRLINYDIDKCDDECIICFKNSSKSMGFDYKHNESHIFYKISFNSEVNDDDCWTFDEILIVKDCIENLYNCDNIQITFYSK